MRWKHGVISLSNWNRGIFKCLSRLGLFLSNFYHFTIFFSLPVKKKKTRKLEKHKSTMSKSYFHMGLFLIALMHFDFSLTFCASLVAQAVNNLHAMQDTQVWFLGWEDPLEENMQPTPVFLLGKSHSQRSLVDYSPQGCKKIQSGLNNTASSAWKYVILN